MIVYKLPSRGYPHVKNIENDLRALQAEVGGSIETLRFFGRNLIRIINENGRIDGLLENQWAPGIHGDLIIVGVKGEEFCSLTANQIISLDEIYYPSYRRWVHADESFPDDMVDVLVCTTEPSGRPVIVKGHRANGHWVHPGQSPVTHWMPLPMLPVS